MWCNIQYPIVRTFLFTLWVLTLCTGSIICTADYWTDAVECAFEDVGKFYCEDNIKKVCNFNLKIESYDFMEQEELGMNCTARGMTCNPYNDGQRVCFKDVKNDIPIDTNDPYYEYFYYTYSCCLPLIP